jgi:chorismate mutase
LTLIKDFKKKYNIPIYVPEREQELFSRLTTMAKELNLSKDFVTELWSIILQESKRFQSE